MMRPEDHDPAPSRFASASDRISPEAAERRWPGSITWFDWQCPHLASAPDLVFRAIGREETWYTRKAPARLYAMADAVGDYGAMMRRYSKANDRYDERSLFTMAAVWIPEVGIWRRHVTTPKVTPWRKEPRPWPTRDAVPDLELDQRPPGPTPPRTTPRVFMPRGVVQVTTPVPVKVGDVVAATLYGFFIPAVNQLQTQRTYTVESVSEDGRTAWVRLG